MKYTITFSAESDLFIVTTDGRMSASGFIAMGRDLLNHPDWLKNRNVLFDHRALNFESVSPAELSEIRSFHIEHEEQIGAGRSAMIVAQGLTSEWNTLWAQGKKISTDNKVRIFEEYAKAERWVLDRA